VIYKINADREVLITVSQVQYLNNILEKEPSTLKRVTKPMIGLKFSWRSSIVVAGVDLIHMFRIGQVSTDSVMSFDDKFYALTSTKPEHLSYWLAT
jgi:transposase-like protein